MEQPVAYGATPPPQTILVRLSGVLAAHIAAQAYPNEPFDQTVLRLLASMRPTQDSTEATTYPTHHQESQ